MGSGSDKAPAKTAPQLISASHISESVNGELEAVPEGRRVPPRVVLPDDVSSGLSQALRKAPGAGNEKGKFQDIQTNIQTTGVKITRSITR